LGVLARPLHPILKSRGKLLPVTDFWQSEHYG